MGSWVEDIDDFEIEVYNKRRNSAWSVTASNQGSDSEDTDSEDDSFDELSISSKFNAKMNLYPYTNMAGATRSSNEKLKSTRSSGVKLRRRTMKTLAQVTDESTMKVQLQIAGWDTQQWVPVTVGNTRWVQLSALAMDYTCYINLSDYTMKERPPSGWVRAMENIY